MLIFYFFHKFYLLQCFIVKYMQQLNIFRLQFISLKKVSNHNLNTILIIYNKS